MAPTAPLPAEGYSAAASARVYAALGDAARQALAGGHTVVADAVFERPADRDAIERVAMQAHVPFAGLWLDASPELCARRVEGRRDDASDASAAVVRAQASRDPGPLRWARVDAALSKAATRDEARAVLALQPV